MNSSKNEIEVVHNTNSNRFEAQLEQALAEARYTIDGNIMVLTHTNVPEQFEGRGIASQLARTALNYARTNSYQVRPECPFMSSYIERHPEYQDLKEKQ